MSAKQVYLTAHTAIRASTTRTTNKNEWTELATIIKRDYPTIYQSAQDSVLRTGVKH